MIRTGGTAALFRTIAAAAVLLPAALSIGCNNTAEMTQLRDRVAEAETRVEKLQRDNAELRAEMQTLRQQLDTLRELGPGRLEKLYTVSQIKLGSRTGGVNLDDDPGDHEAVKVFLQPVDARGDVLKAAGSATVELYDLAAGESDNLIGRYEWSVDELAGAWYSGFLAYHYALECPWDEPPAHEEITVRVTFTEYLTGKSFTAQTVCTVRLPQ
ncbi:MAG: hypothetical protein ACP5HU_02380 [Phycisphaerae bacterium]